MQHFLPHLLEQTNRLVRDMLNNTLSAEDLQTDQWTILVYLSDGLGHAMGELADAAAINPSKLTKCVDKMVSKGLVHRSVDLNDQRKVVFEQRREFMAEEDVRATIDEMRHGVVDDLVAKAIPAGRRASRCGS